MRETCLASSVAAHEGEVRGTHTLPTEKVRRTVQSTVSSDLWVMPCLKHFPDQMLLPTGTAQVPQENALQRRTFNVLISEILWDLTIASDPVFPHGIQSINTHACIHTLAVTRQIG